MPASFACGSEDQEAEDEEIMCLECGEVQPPSDGVGEDAGSGFKASPHRAGSQSDLLPILRQLSHRSMPYVNICLLYNPI